MSTLSVASASNIAALSPNKVGGPSHKTDPLRIVECTDIGQFIDVTAIARAALQESGSPAGFFLRERTEDYYQESRAKMFTTEDNRAGLAVKLQGADAGEIVSVFTSPADSANVRKSQLRQLFDQAVETGGRHFSCYDVNVRLLQFYNKLGFVVVATMPTKDISPDEAASKYPATWNEWPGRVDFDDGRPQGLYLVHDPHRRLARREIVAVQNYAGGCSIQQESLAQIDRTNYELLRTSGRL